MVFNEKIKKIFVMIAAIVFSGCTEKLETRKALNDITQTSSEEKSERPFHLNLNDVPEATRKILLHAASDFRDSIAGGSPQFAKLESELLDGGTGVYKGEGYKVILIHKGGNVGSVRGFYYGPILKFDDPLLQSKDSEISQIEFYSTEEIKKLKSNFKKTRSSN